MVIRLVTDGRQKRGEPADGHRHQERIDRRSDVFGYIYADWRHQDHGSRVVDHGGQQHCGHEHDSQHSPGGQGAAQVREGSRDPRRAARRFQRLPHGYHGTQEDYYRPVYRLVGFL